MGIIKKSCIVLVLMFFVKNVWANLPFYPIQFPRDEAAHFENTPYQGQFNKMTEWWYYNGTLTSKTGKKLGYFLSFNYMYSPKYNILTPIIQVQIADVTGQKVYGKTLVLSDKDAYSLSASTLDIHYGKTYNLQKVNGSYLLQANILSNQGVNLEFNLKYTQKPSTDVLLVGGNGQIDMGHDTNSYYYSFTKLVTEGYVRVGNEIYELDPEHSLSWFDHQWGDFATIPGRNQWMWTSVQLENGLDINLAVGLDSLTSELNAGWGNFVMPDNSRVYIKDFHKFSYTAQPVPPGLKHPLVYDLVVPELKLKLRLEAILPGQDLNGIWEGASTVTGTYQGQPISGQATTENTVVYQK